MSTLHDAHQNGVVVVSISPLTDPLYQEQPYVTTTSRTLQQYYAAMEVTRRLPIPTTTTDDDHHHYLLQRIALGDLVVYPIDTTNDKSQTTKKLTKTATNASPALGIGQVLTLSSVLVQQQSHNKQGTPSLSYHCQVRPLYPWEHVKHRLTTRQRRQIQKDCRFAHALLETCDSRLVQTLSLQQLCPIQIQLHSKQDFVNNTLESRVPVYYYEYHPDTNNKGSKHHNHTSSWIAYWEWHYFVYGTLIPTTTSQDHQETNNNNDGDDDTAWIVDTSTCREWIAYTGIQQQSSCGWNLPSMLQRAWRTLSTNNNNHHDDKDHHPLWTKALVQALQTKTTQTLANCWTSSEFVRFVIPQNTTLLEDERKDQEVDDGEESRWDDENYARNHCRKRPTATASKKRKSLVETKALESKRRRKRQTIETVDTRSSDSDQELWSSSPLTPIIAHIFPVIHTQMSTKSNSKYNKAPLLFYSEIKIQTETEYWKHQIRDLSWFFGRAKKAATPKQLKSLAKQWTIHVGDLLAIAESFAPSTMEEHRPFQCRWNVGQVLSIFETKGSQDDPDTAPTVMMEIRWMYRPSDLPKSISKVPSILNKKLGCNECLRLVEVDEHVTQVSVTMALGRVLASSLTCPKRSQKNELCSVDSDGVPTIHVSIKHAYYSRFDEQELRPVKDWVGGLTSAPKTTESMVGPISRGLYCEKSWAGRVKSLQRKYEKYLVERYKLQDLQWKMDQISALSSNDITKPGNDDLESGSASRPTCFDQWPAEFLEMGHAHVPRDKAVLYSAAVPGGMENEEIEFHMSVDVTVVHKRCDRRATTKKSVATEWSVQVGDVVAIAVKDAPLLAANNTNVDSSLLSSPLGKKNSRWGPFLGPWRYGQILSIYTSGERKGKRKRDQSCSPVYLEVRWLYRRHEVPSHCWSWMPPILESRNGENKHDEVYETFQTEKGVPATRILGRVDIFLGHHADTSSRRATNGHENIVEAAGVPTCRCRCRFLFVSSVDRFQPLFCADRRASEWHRWFLERAFKSSAFVRQHSGLLDSIEFCLNVRISSEAGGVMDLFGTLLKNEKDAHNIPSAVPVLWNDKGPDPCESYLSIPLEPRWEFFSDGPNVCTPNDRSGLTWTLHVGELVAVQVDSSTLSNHFPFSCPWAVCQVLSIYRNNKSWNIEVRWMERKAAKGESSSMELDFLVETNRLSDTPMSALSVLGPVSLVTKEKVWDDKAWTWHPTFLPVAMMQYRDCAVASNIVYAEKTSSIDALRSFIRRGLEKSKRITASQLEQIMIGLKSLAEDALSAETACPLPMTLLVEEREALTDGMSVTHCDKTSPQPVVFSPSGISEATDSRAQTCSAPFHVDEAGGIEFHKEFIVHPPPEKDVYQSKFLETRKMDRSTTPWRIKMGDAVVVRYDAGGRRAKADKFPFLTPFGVAEVVTIFERKADTAKLSSESSPLESPGLRLEIRWLYRANELPGSVRKQKRTGAYVAGEEVFESDHYDEISPTSILSIANLFNDEESCKSRLSDLSLSFFCRRFWSVRRKAVLPSSGLSERIDRGRAQSMLFEKYPALRMAIDPHGTVNSSTSRKSISAAGLSRLSAKEAFTRVIEKLSLSDASKEAEEEGSAALIGRKKERGEIMQFLRSALVGTAEDTKSSMFIAGPPGAGKTASVRAAIGDLRREQTATGNLSFEFVALNGMEMRHPTEVYSKLWEQVSGSRERCPPDIAASNLEAFFTDGSASSSNTGKSVRNDGKRPKVFVVLVDEIDYLVTNNQLVLYNLFDWPIRAIQSCSKRRLVVLGVSNTLNLPERLKPRVRSRIGSQRCYFNSYNVQETTAILKAKISQASPDYDVFEEDAIIFAAKKTAALSGDIRKAFRICRTAAETILRDSIRADKNSTSEKMSVVKIKDVLRSCSDSANTAHSRNISFCTPFEALFLIALASLSKASGREHGEFDIDQIVTKMESMSNSTGQAIYSPPPSHFEALEILSLLADSQLISIRAQSQQISDEMTGFSDSAISMAGCGFGAWPLVSMALEDTSIFMALKDTEHRELAQKYLFQSVFA